MTTTRRKSRPPEGGDRTAALETSTPDAAACERPQTGIDRNQIITTRAVVSNEKGFHVTLTLVGMPDGGERRRWLEQLLFGRYRPNTIPETAGGSEPPAGLVVEPIETN